MITHEEVRKELQHYVGEYGMDYYGEKHFPITTKYLLQQKKKDKLLELYQKSHDCIVCCPHQDTFHCVVRYTDDEKFNRLLNEIKALEEKVNE